MRTNLTKLGCGHCGADLHLLYIDDETNEIIVECTNCGNTSCITVTKPEITINWEDKQDGILCPMGN